MAQLTVGVLRGGPSEEYDVSLQTGSQVLKHLRDDRYRPVDIFIDREGVWHRSGLPRQPESALRGIDVVVTALHGTYGEDGTVQQILDRFSIPYTGSRPFESKICMNKALTKKELEGLDVLMPRSRIVHVSDDLETQIFDLWQTFPQPSVVKPVSSGSSMGVSLARTYDGLRDAIHEAFSYSPKVLVEEYIRGKDASCGVIDRFRGADTYALLPIEITPPNDCSFYDYRAKYEAPSTMRCPGNFSDAQKKEMQRVSELVHKKFNLRHYSRSDFMVTPQGVYFLEVNTLPGMTEHSLFPESLKAVGSSLQEFFDHLIGLAR